MATSQLLLPDKLHSRKKLEHWAGRYPAFEREKDEILEKTITSAVKDDRGLTFDELRFLFVWKSGPRNLHHLKKDEPIARLSREAIKEKSVQPLCQLNGIRVPTASALLHFAYPEEFPVIDRRVLVSAQRLDPEDKSTTIGVNLWDEYLEWSVPTAKQHKASLRNFDRALWQYNVEESFKKKYWPE